MAIHCSDIDPLVQSYLDDELTAEETRELREHSSQCEACRARMSREERFRDALREHLAPPSAPEEFRAQVEEALSREDRSLSRARRQAQMSWALPGAATVAAAVALAVFATDRFVPANEDKPLTHAAASKVVGSSPVVVRENHREMSRSLHDYLRVPIRPPQFPGESVDLRGWRPSHLHGRQAAELVYVVEGSGGRYNMMRLHVLDSSNIDLESQDRREAGDKTLWVDDPLGMSSVTYRDRHGIGYVFTSDMPKEDLIDLVTEADLTAQSEELRGRSAAQGR